MSPRRTTCHGYEEIGRIPRLDSSTCLVLVRCVGYHRFLDPVHSVAVSVWDLNSLRSSVISTVSRISSKSLPGNICAACQSHMPVTRRPLHDEAFVRSQAALAAAAAAATACCWTVRRMDEQTSDADTGSTCRRSFRHPDSPIDWLPAGVLDYCTLSHCVVFYIIHNTCVLQRSFGYSKPLGSHNV